MDSYFIFLLLDRIYRICFYFISFRRKLIKPNPTPSEMIDIHEGRFHYQWQKLNLLHD
jgi:hypothetical protein